MPDYNDWSAQAGRYTGRPASTQPRRRARPTTTVPRRAAGPARGSVPASSSGSPAAWRRTEGFEDTATANKRARAKLLHDLQAALGGQARPGSIFDGLPGPQAAPPPPSVPLAPVAGNQYAGVEGAIANQTRDSQRYLAAQGGATRGALAANGGGRLIEGGAGTFAQQLAQQLGATAAEAGALRTTARQAYATDELRRKGELAKALYDQATQQYKANQESGGSLSLSMMESLAAEGLDPMQFAGNPIAAAIALGRLRYARRGETNGITPSMIAQAAQLGLDYRQFASPAELAQAIGSARRGQYGSTDLAQQFLAFVGG